MADAGKDNLDKLIDEFAQRYREPCVGFGEQVRTEQGPETWQRLVNQHQAETSGQAAVSAPGYTLGDGRESDAAQTWFRAPLDLVPDTPDADRGEAGFEAG
jgi:hypothetical protein